MVSGTSKHVAVISFPGYGHIRPTLAIVEELLGRGHRVTYLAAHRFTGDVALTGATVVGYESMFPESVPTRPNVQRMMLEFLRESFAPLATALARFDDDPPDLIMHDALVSDTARILSRKFGAPTVRVFPGFGGNADVPLNGSEPAPDAQPVNPADPALLEFGQRLAETLRSLDVDRYTDGQIASGDDAVHNLVCVPGAFQPRLESFDERFSFVGPCLRKSELRTDWTPRDRAVPLALVSLGTSTNSAPDFFRTSAKAFAHLPWQVEMTLGWSTDPASLGELPPNVAAHNWLPHLAVLRHARVFVCQAGSGSVMESLYRGTPMVVIPKSADSIAIADRVVELGLGHRLDIDDLTPDTLVDMVLTVAEDRQMRQRATEFRGEVSAAGGARRAAATLERLLPR